MQLSKHFKLEEFTKSMIATRKGIDNSPGAGDIKNLENVCYEILEPVRAKFDKPITITSGYRSEALCEAIGSKKTSQHAKGQAVDFEIAGVPNIQTAYWLQANVDFDQLILEFYKKTIQQVAGCMSAIMKKDLIENKYSLMMEEATKTAFQT